MNASYTSLLNDAPTPEQLANAPTLPLFAKPSLDFVQALSGELLKDRAIKAFPELVALAYWLRKSNLERLSRTLAERIGDTIQHPRGTVFHIAPSNVDTIFVYSWILALLSGNKNIVRLPSKNSPQTDLLVRAVTTTLSQPEHRDIAMRTLLVRYAVNDAITTQFSSVCDVRVIWGGDETIRQVRRIPMPAYAIDVAFCNKYSLAVIDIDNWLLAEPTLRQELAQAFYNDAFGFDQMACSSPRLVLWVGDAANQKQAGQDFWARIQHIVHEKQTSFDDVDYVNKLVVQDSAAIRSSAHHVISVDNTVSRTWLDSPALHIDLHCGAGLFFEAHLQQLQDIKPLLSRSVQTLSYACVDRQNLSDMLRGHDMRGIDRVVPFGQALSFSESWDGYDLLRTFLRQITLL